MSERERLERATESTLAKAVTRFGVPGMLALLGFFGSWMLTDIRAEQQDQADRQILQGEKIQQVSSDVELLNAKVDNGLVWRIGELERRINALDRNVPMERRP